MAWGGAGSDFARSKGVWGVAERCGYKGIGLQTVDDKNRVALPSTLRTLIERNIGMAAETKEGRVLTIATHETDPCIVIYDEPYYDQMMLDVEERARAHAGPNGRPSDAILRQGIGISDVAGFDANGRFILPGLHKDMAKIDRHALFFGLGKFIEVWDPKTLMAWPDAPPALKAACQYHCNRMKVAL